MLAGGFERPSRSSSRCSCRSAPDDRWLALRVPAGRTSSTATGCSTPRTTRGRSTRRRPPVRRCCSTSGPRWSRARTETTGIAFHYDRPNSEPPQALLLVTPAACDGAWQWDDLVDALHETLDLAKQRARSSRRTSTTTAYAPLPARDGHGRDAARHLDRAPRSRANNDALRGDGADG